MKKRSCAPTISSPKLRVLESRGALLPSRSSFSPAGSLIKLSLPLPPGNDRRVHEPLPAAFLPMPHTDLGGPPARLLNLLSLVAFHRLNAPTGLSWSLGGLSTHGDRDRLFRTTEPVRVTWAIPSVPDNSGRPAIRKPSANLAKSSGDWCTYPMTSFRLCRGANLGGHETSKQLIIETRAPIPAKPGRKARHDYEYERNGVANLFMVFAPLEGWRHVTVTDRHTAIDYAHALRDMSDVHFPDAAKILVVQDNLNTHKPASLYEAFPAAEARRLVERFEWHYTPNASRASARQLAQHSRTRTRCARVAVSGSPHRRQANPRPRSQRMAGPPQQAPRQGQLAIQNRRRSRQAEETVPSVRVTHATSRLGPPPPLIKIVTQGDFSCSAQLKSPSAL
jgi:hypothetical protein